MDSNFLSLLINEEIYVINKSKKKECAESASKVAAAGKIGLSERVSPSTHQEKKNSPPLPNVAQETSERTIPLAIFYETTSDEDIQLLEKIIAACKLRSESYEVFNEGLQKDIAFEKALVFVAQAKQFYTPIDYQESQILYSKPLNILAQNKQEKATLWGALRAFIS